MVYRCPATPPSQGVQLPPLSHMASDHHGKNNGGPNQWIIRVKITARFLGIHLSLFDQSSRVPAGDV